jgi:hypothetical protein
LLEDQTITTFIVTKRDYSEKAQRTYGSPIVWRFIAKTRLRPPQDETGFRLWLWQLIKEHGPGDYAVTRTQQKGERRGFHPIGLYSIDENQIIVLKRYPEVKSHPGLPASRQLWHKGTIRRKRLRTSGRGKLRF